MNAHITAPLPELVEPPTDYQERGWVAAVPAKALMRPNLPAVGRAGDPSCPCCGARLPEGFIMGRRPPAALRCARCHQAITWIGWNEHVTRTLKERMDARIAATELDGDDTDADDDPEEEPCRCCGEYCDPDEDSGYCLECAAQGCRAHY